MGDENFLNDLAQVQKPVTPASRRGVNADGVVYVPVPVPTPARPRSAFAVAFMATFGVLAALALVWVVCQNFPSAGMPISPVQETHSNATPARELMSLAIHAEDNGRTYSVTVENTGMTASGAFVLVVTNPAYPGWEERRSMLSIEPGYGTTAIVKTPTFEPDPKRENQPKGRVEF